MTSLGDVQREWLYDGVWRLPMIELGEELGVSRATIKWACLQLGVPLPPQAYWTHLRRGLRRDPRPPLPPLVRGQPRSISRAALLKQERPKRKKNPELERRRAEERRRAVEEYLELEALNGEVDDWHRANLMRSYLAELDRRIKAGGRLGDDYEEWRKRAERAIEELDNSNLRVKLPRR
jgi:hypothetical protein